MVEKEQLPVRWRLSWAGEVGRQFPCLARFPQGIGFLDIPGGKGAAVETSGGAAA
jgi:hypothetical protein